MAMVPVAVFAGKSDRHERKKRGQRYMCISWGTMAFICKKLTIGDTNNFGIICSIYQELGLSVRHFIQPDICCFLINYQPVVIVANFGIPSIQGCET